MGGCRGWIVSDQGERGAGAEVLAVARAGARARAAAGEWAGVVAAQDAARSAIRNIKLGPERVKGQMITKKVRGLIAEAEQERHLGHAPWLAGPAGGSLHLHGLRGAGISPERRLLGRGWGDRQGRGLTRRLGVPRRPRCHSRRWALLRRILWSERRRCCEVCGGLGDIAKRKRSVKRSRKTEYI